MARYAPVWSADSRHLLVAGRAPGDERQARVLARRLDRLPLALHLAGSYLGSNAAHWSTFTAYGDAVGVGAHLRIAFRGCKAVRRRPESPR